MVLLLLPILAALLLTGLAAFDFAGGSKADIAPQLEVGAPLASELPLEARGDGSGKRAALARAGFAVAAIENSRRKLRAQQRPPAQPLNPTVSFFPAALKRPLTRRRHAQRPLRPSRSSRPFFSQGPPSRKTS